MEQRVSTLEPDEPRELETPSLLVPCLFKSLRAILGCTASSRRSSSRNLNTNVGNRKLTKVGDVIDFGTGWFVKDFLVNIFGFARTVDQY